MVITKDMSCDVISSRMEHRRVDLGVRDWNPLTVLVFASQHARNPVTFIRLFLSTNPLVTQSLSNDKRTFCQNLIFYREF